MHSSLIQYFGQFLIAYRTIRVSRLQGKFATNGKSMVSEYELKTVRAIVILSNLVMKFLTLGR
jgi:hypothetical protein